MTDASKLVYVNVAWMSRYRGPAGDKAEGNFGFLKDNEIGHESWNFQELDGKLYGYVPGSSQINIRKLGAKREDASISGITVVWISRNPRTKRTTIIGWYKNATIHRDADHFRLKRAPRITVGYQIEAPTDGGHLLPVDARQFLIPTKKEKGNLGQNPVWYGKDREFNLLVLEYVSGRRNPPSNQGAPRQTDPELRRKIEQAAVNHAIAHFKSEAGGRHQVKSVEKDGVGWDLEAFSEDGDILKIEVKGLSGKDLVVELTPNEFAQMKSPSHRANYIIYVLLEALEPSARAEIFRHDAIRSKGGELMWVNDNGQALKVEPLIAARLTI